MLAPRVTVYFLFSTTDLKLQHLTTLEIRPLIQVQSQLRIITSNSNLWIRQNNFYSILSLCIFFTNKDWFDQDFHTSISVICKEPFPCFPKFHTFSVSFLKFNPTLYNYSIDTINTKLHIGKTYLMRFIKSKIRHII